MTEQAAESAPGEEAFSTEDLVPEQQPERDENGKVRENDLAEAEKAAGYTEDAERADQSGLA